jgi:hypothetical protein
MRSMPSEEIFFPEKIDIIDLDGNRVCQLKSQIPARKEIPILKLLICTLEETELKTFIEQITPWANKTEISPESIMDAPEGIDNNFIGILFNSLPKILKTLPDSIVKCFSILVELDEEEVLERFNLAYMIEVLVPFLLYAFKTWMEQFQAIGKKAPIPTIQTP